jgi:hypothetical protein
MSEIKFEDLQKAEEHLLRLREQQQQIAVLVARQEGVVLYLRERLGAEQAEQTPPD